MMEHEMCCGTTCDKQQVAAEFERIAERNRSLEALLKLAIKERDNLQIMVDANLRVNGRLRTMAIKNGYSPAGEMNEQEYLLNRFDEIKQERDEALAQNERFRKLISEVVETDGNKFYFMGTDWGNSAIAALEEQPPAALAALKAEWQEEAFGIAAQICEKKANEYANGNYEHGSRQHGKIVAANSCAYEIRAYVIRQRAQEAGDANPNNPPA